MERSTGDREQARTSDPQPQSPRRSAEAVLSLQRMAGNAAVAELVARSRSPRRIVARTLSKQVPKPEPGPTITTEWLQNHYEELKRAWEEMRDDPGQAARADAAVIERLRGEIVERLAVLLGEINPPPGTEAELVTIPRQDLVKPQTALTRAAADVIASLTAMRKAINAAWDSWDVERQVAAAASEQDRYKQQAKQREREQKSSAAKERKPVGREGDEGEEKPGGVEFPHQGKHQPQKAWLGQSVKTTPEVFPDPVLKDHTSGKGDAAVYRTANPRTVIAWEREAREQGLLLSDRFTIVYGFKENIGADHGEMTRFVRIDGDHGHPIIESHQSLNTSFEAYINKEIERAKGNDGRQRELSEFLRKLGFSPSTWGLKEPK